MDELTTLLAQWKRLGIEVDARPAPRTPDVERLIVETARLLPYMARLLPVATTWLVSCERLVCRHRLASFAAGITSTSHSACLGLLLDFVRATTFTDHLALPIRKCSPLLPPVPLLEAERKASYYPLVQLEADAIARRWGLLTPRPHLVLDAMRPIDWILAANPRLRERALLRGDLGASILACITHEASSGSSESSLARTLGATRKALRDSLDHLQFCGLIVRRHVGRSVQICLPDV